MIGQHLSHFRILARVGEGGMGVVYRAEDEKLRRLVAVKVLPPELMADEDRRARFLREARAAASVNHSNIATVHEVDEADGVVFIAMELVEGRTLRETIGDRPLAAAEVGRLGIEIAEGLAAAHDAGVVHRDLKPSNVVVTASGHVKILDFGLAKLVQSGIAERPTVMSELETLSGEHTHAGRVMGTLEYMSPEQALGLDVDARTDVFSLGVVLYEMATGERPFRGVTPTALVDSILHHAPPSPRALNAGVPRGLARVIDRCLRKRREERYASAGEVVRDLQRATAASRRRRGRTIAGTAAAAVLLAAIAAGVWWTLGVRWARREVIPEVERLAEQARLTGDSEYHVEAFALARRAQRFLADDARLQEAFQLCSNLKEPLTVETDPPGARVSMRRYVRPESGWTPLGVTPLRVNTLPWGRYVFRLEKEGFEPVEAVAPPWVTLRRRLDRAGTIPSGMVRVAGGEIEGLGKMPDLFLDRLEVTNRQYKAFVDAGGYRDRARWPQAFQDEGKEVPWEEAMRRLVDGTGRPGPSTWQAGDFPKGQADYPVGGISWYEAAAYCAFAGRSLPTRHHWEQALGPRGERSAFFAPLLARLSNFGGEGPAPVGSHHGMTAFGALDMAGNVREWCWNPTENGRLIRGGAWDDAEYMNAKLTQQSPWNRAPQNGVRCVVDPEPALVPKAAFDPTTLVSGRDYRAATPASDAVFASFSSRFDYDPSDLEATVEERDESEEEWIREKVTFNAAYEGKRVIAHLLLPRDGPHPFQVVVFFPGDGVWGAPPEGAFRDMRVHLDFYVKSGRMAVYPIYMGSFERSSEMDQQSDWKPYEYAEWVVKWVKDYRRVLDYLETRPDVDRSRIAHYGFSAGGVYGGIIPAIDERVHLNLLNLGGFGGDERPEVNPVNFLPHVRIPTLLLSGELDPTFPVETDAIPFFRLLGTPVEDKRHVLYDTDHYIPKKEVIKECLGFLDRYFGPPGTVASNPVPASAPSR